VEGDRVAESNAKQPRKNGPGRPFQPGQSGNPGGRKPIAAPVKAALAELNMPAIARLRQLIGSDDEDIALRACLAVLERNLGKVMQPVEVDASKLQDSELKRAVVDVAKQWAEEGAVMQ
jgi:hypothetical protein